MSLSFVLILKRQVRKKTAELKNSNKELTEQGALLASIINGTSDAVFIKNTAGCYIVVNDEVERLGFGAETDPPSDHTAIFRYQVGQARRRCWLMLHADSYLRTRQVIPRVLSSG